MNEHPAPDPAAFNGVAAEYDSNFSYTLLGQMLRQRVWRHLECHFHRGQHILDIACGTGEDALWMARRGVRVTALDGSKEMAARAARKAQMNGYGDMISVYHYSLEDFISHPEVLGDPSIFGSAKPDQPIERNTSAEVTGQFDGAISNFGGLNVLHKLNDFARALASAVSDGGKLALVLMGPLNPWEIGWHLFHGDLKRAFRRFGGSSPAQVGQATINVWYPSPSRLVQDFDPWFRPLARESLGLLLPPSYLGHFVDRRPGLYESLDKIEIKIGKYSGGVGDHYIQILERTRAGLET